MGSVATPPQAGQVIVAVIGDVFISFSRAVYDTRALCPSSTESLYLLLRWKV